MCQSRPDTKFETMDSTKGTSVYTDLAFSTATSEKRSRLVVA